MSVKDFFLRRQKKNIENYHRTFQSPMGKEVLLDLIREHHVLSTSYAKGDSHETAFREGERNVVLRILTLLNIRPLDIEKLIQEGQENELAE